MLGQRIVIFIGLIHASLAFGATEMPIQADVDRAFELILSTSVGKAICRDILGSDPHALEHHLGISPMVAAKIAAGSCQSQTISDWIYPTSPSDIRKLEIQANKPRRYKVIRTGRAFPIESWTDSISNTTTILVENKAPSFSRLVQILAHETAVYFDSKANPLHPGAQDLPQLRSFQFSSISSYMDPLIAISDPLLAHTMTYLRALQVEFSILQELVSRKVLYPPQDLKDEYLLYLVSDRCAEICIKELLNNTRTAYKNLALPLLAFAPHYRAIAFRAISQFDFFWTEAQIHTAQDVFNNIPVQFMKTQFNGDAELDLFHFFIKDQSQIKSYEVVEDFLDKDLWPLEQKSIDEAHLISGMSLLEFMKRPLLSGYNISLASGPRVRVRTGNIE